MTEGCVHVLYFVLRGCRLSAILQSARHRCCCYLAHHRPPPASYSSTVLHRPPACCFPLPRFCICLPAASTQLTASLSPLPRLPQYACSVAAAASVRVLPHLTVSLPTPQQLLPLLHSAAIPAAHPPVRHGEAAALGSSACVYAVCVRASAIVLCTVCRPASRCLSPASSAGRLPPNCRCFPCVSCGGAAGRLIHSGASAVFVAVGTRAGRWVKCNTCSSGLGHDPAFRLTNPHLPPCRTSRTLAATLAACAWRC